MNRISTNGFERGDNKNDKIINAVIDKDIQFVKSYTSPLRIIRDIQNNNLLHLATLNGHVDMILYLLCQNIDIYHKNKFGLTPWNYAIRSNDQDIINIYINHINKKLIEEKDSRSMDIIILNKNNKRLRDENDGYRLENNRLLDENRDLIRENKKLKVSVNALTQAIKK